VIVPPLPETPLQPSEFDLDVRLEPVAETPAPGPLGTAPPSLRAAARRARAEAHYAVQSANANAFAVPDPSACNGFASTAPGDLRNCARRGRRFGLE